MDKTQNLLAINEYLAFKCIPNERCSNIKTKVQAFKHGVSVFEDLEVEIYFSENEFGAKELSFMDIEHTQLHEVLNKHISVNHHFQSFIFEIDRLIITDTNNTGMEIDIY